MITAIAFSVVDPVLADEFFAAPQGLDDAAGTRDSPWSLSTALSGRHHVPAGSTIWLLPGIYRHADRSPHATYVVRLLQGTADKPIQIRGVVGTRATIDGGLAVGDKTGKNQPPKHLWIRDLEITVSEKQRTSRQRGSAPNDIRAPFGGLNVYQSRACKFINLVIHDNVGNGIGAWSAAVDTEFYGCLVYDNGWSAPDRGHGHGFYGQNNEGWKVVSNCIFSVPAGRGGNLGQFYGSGDASLDNFRLVQNIAFAAAPRRSAFLLGGGAVAHNNHALNNYFYNGSLQLGYNRAGCVGGRAEGNVIHHGSLNLRFYDECQVTNNLVVDGAVSVAASGDLDVRENSVFREKPPADLEPKTVLLPDRYNPGRAHLVVFNWHNAKTVTVSASQFLKAGQKYQLYAPTDFYGKPIATGVCQHKAIRIALQKEFSAFVVIKQPD